MATNPDALGAITYEAESSWGENTNTYATHRIPNLIPVDASGLVHNKSTAEYTEQYRGAGNRPVLMTMGGSFRMKIDLCGHGATTSGSPSVDAIETFLNLVWGGTGAFSLATSQTATGGTTAVVTTSGANGVTAGGLVRIGALADTDGEGQFYSVSDHSSSNLTVDNELLGAPQSGAVIFPVYMMFSNSAPTNAAITGTRFELLTANTQYRCHGCYPTGVTFSGLSAGERPQLEIEWGVSWYTDAGTTTFPSTVTSNRYAPSPVAAGSLHINAVGTTTRNAIVYRNLTIDYTLGVEPLRGPGGVNQYQDIVGAVRTNNESCKLTFTADSDAAGTTTLAGWGRSEVDRFAVLTLNPNAGRAVGFKFPKVCSTTVPTQIRDGNVNRVRFEGMAYTSDTLTSELTRARMIMGFA